MTADEFIEWALALPSEEHYELVAGQRIARDREPAAHARVKLEVIVALTDAFTASGLQGEALPNGPVVVIGNDTAYEPDALVRCGEPLADDAVRVVDPVIVVEVVSPISRGADHGAKLEDYFRLPSLHHYLLVRTQSRSVIHHRRDSEERIETRIVRDGLLVLDPPGITVAVERFFP